MISLDGEPINVGDRVAWDPMFGFALRPGEPIPEIQVGYVVFVREQTDEVQVQVGEDRVWVFVEDILSVEHQKEPTAS